MALEAGSESDVKNLLRYGADANVKDFEGCSSLENSLICDQIGTFKVLIYNNWLFSFKNSLPIANGSSVSLSNE